MPKTVNQQENIPLANISNNETYTDSRFVTIFEECDTNGDGLISCDELENYVNNHETECYFIPKRILKQIHKNADTDGDKQLNFDEFVQLMQNKDLVYHFHNCVNIYVHHLIPHPKKETPDFRLQALRVEEPNLCDEYSCWPPPIFMFVISVVEFVLFIVDELSEKDSTLTASGITGNKLLYDPYKKKDIWRFLTYMFVHIGYAHLITNLIVQLVLGIPLEMVNKWWRVLLIYFLGGIAGCLAHALIDGNVRLGGASGGVYALMTAHFAQVIMNWSDLPYAYVQLIVFGLIIFCDLGTAAYQRYYLMEINEIGVTCHIGGALAGLLVGIYVLRNVHITVTEKYIWWGAVVAYVLLTGAAIFGVIYA